MKRVLVIVGGIVAALIGTFVLLVIGLMVITSAANKITESANRQTAARPAVAQNKTPTPQPSPAPPPPKTPEPSPPLPEPEKPRTSTTGKLTEQDYESIQTGDDCTELVARLGKPGHESRTETEFPGIGTMSMDMYTWRGDGLFGTVTVICNNGEVYMKSTSKF